MPFTHHSHSGQYCHHARDRLEEIVEMAIAKKMSVLALTEHMPREDGDLYPEEIRDDVSSAKLTTTFAFYYTEARRLQLKYSPQIHILVGVEVDWIHPIASRDFIQQLKQDYDFELIVGGVHHVHGIPTDYDRQKYLHARRISNSNARSGLVSKNERISESIKTNDREVQEGGEDEEDDEHIFADYFDHQHTLLLSLHPDIVAHFDVIRLWSDDPDGSFRKWPRVWDRVIRNLRVVKDYGGVMEINSAGLRKGMKEPYPGGEICKEFLAMGGQFTLSDDSHGVAQVATHYAQTFTFLEENGIDSLVYFEKTANEEGVSDNSRITKKTIGINVLRKTHPFFS